MSHAALAHALKPAEAPKSRTHASVLRVNPPGDTYEREADRAADQVVSGNGRITGWSLSKIAMSAPVQRKCSCEGQCDECKKDKEDKKLQRKAQTSQSGPTPVTAPPIVHDVLRGPGRPIEPAVRSFMESRFGHDFSRVRIHTDARAADSADAVNAHAYTAASNVVFGRGQYAPESAAGKQLLAHELAHVVQQGGSAPAPSYQFIAPDHHAEREAKAAGRSASAGVPAQIKSTLPAGQIGREEKTTTPPPGAGAGTAPAKPAQPLRFDILGADTPLADFLAKEAKRARDPDLRVSSLEDLINQLEAQTPAGSGRCVQHINIYNHGAPGYQAIAGEGGKKGKPSATLPKSGFTLDWLYEPPNQAALTRLRNVFCCGASMDWLGCGVAGVTAQGGKRTQQEIDKAGEIGSDEKHDLDERYKEYGDRYQNEEDAKKHGATLQGATFGSITVGTWADATCTTIRSATDFVFHNADKGTYRVGFNGENLEFKPSSAGQCTCDAATGRVHGTWNPGKGIDPGTPKWQFDLALFNQALKPPSGSPDNNLVKQKMLQLVADVAPDLEIPPGLPVGPKAEPLVDAASTDPNVVAQTYDYLAFCNPADAWQWIRINRMSFQQTPGYTRTTLNHELQHAADIYVAAFEFKLTNGPPPPAPPAACKPDYVPSASDPFGKYVLDFKKFRAIGLPESRHLEIYATTAEKNFQHFSPSEKLEWFSGMITEVPPDVPATEQLPTEPLVASVFSNPLPYEAGLAAKMEARLFYVVKVLINGQSHAHEIALAKARTLLNHFGQVWAVMPGDRKMLFDAAEAETKNLPPKP